MVNAGGDFWQQVRDWGVGRKLLSERDVGVLTSASRVPERLPSEKQAELAMDVLARLQREGFNADVRA